jgi:hypothetical protein
MTLYELANNQRRYFGLLPVSENWERRNLSDDLTVYFDFNRIAKVLNYRHGYVEYDCEINTKDRQILLPKTFRGKEQKLTIPRILKIRGSGVQFSGSFLGGLINVYDNKRNLVFIKGHLEEGEIKNYRDIDIWISNYIARLPNDYFNWLNDQLSRKRLSLQFKEGDIIAFKISKGEYGFARILLDIFNERKKGDAIRPELSRVHARSLLVAPYAYYADTLNIDIDALLLKEKMAAICIFDLEVYRGEMPIIGFRQLSEVDRQIPFPQELVTSITIRYTKTDIETFIATGSKNIE